MAEEKWVMAEEKSARPLGFCPPEKRLSATFAEISILPISDVLGISCTFQVPTP
jgi:hypothetical protein